jgi:hypothetical protein
MVIHSHNHSLSICLNLFTQTGARTHSHNGSILGSRPLTSTIRLSWIAATPAGCSTLSRTGQGHWQPWPALPIPSSPTITVTLQHLPFVNNPTSPLLLELQPKDGSFLNAMTSERCPWHLIQWRGPQSDHERAGDPE